MDHHRRGIFWRHGDFSGLQRTMVWLDQHGHQPGLLCPAFLDDSLSQQPAVPLDEGIPLWELATRFDLSLVRHRPLLSPPGCEYRTSLLHVLGTISGRSEVTADQSEFWRV